MAINFPASPTAGQMFIPTTATGSGPIWVYRNGAWRRNTGTALRSNKIVNPVMQISQQYGDNPVSVGGAYVVDQWFGSGDNLTYQRIPKTTQRGSKYRIKVTAAVPSQIQMSQIIEGNRIVDLNYGTNAAKCSVFRFGMNCPAGTWDLNIYNYSMFDRWTFNGVTPAEKANVDVEYVIAMPPLTAAYGTWITDNQASVWVQLVYNSLPGGAALELFDVGWYADPNMTGVAPEFQVPNIEDDLQDCLRYWYPAYRFDGVVETATKGYGWCSHYVPMRIAPAYSLVGALRCYDAGVAPNIASISNYNVNAESGALVLNASGFTIGRPLKTLVDGQVANYVAVNARM